MSEFLQLLFEGLSLGATYALVALGFVVIYRASGVINFAQGAMLLLGAYLISWLAVDVGVPFGLAVLAAMAAAPSAPAFTGSRCAASSASRRSSS
jgi:branched-chain amino acid transport system permease protein